MFTKVLSFPHAAYVKISFRIVFPHIWKFNDRALNIRLIFMEKLFFGMTICVFVTGSSSKFIGNKEGIAYFNSKQSARTPEKTVRLSSQVSLNKLTLKTEFS